MSEDLKAIIVQIRYELSICINMSSQYGMQPDDCEELNERLKEIHVLFNKVAKACLKSTA